MITRVISIDARRDDDEESDRRAAGVLYGIDPGARVIVFVGNRRYVAPYLADQIASFVPQLHIELQGSDVATEAWMRYVLGQSGAA